MPDLKGTMINRRKMLREVVKRMDAMDGKPKRDALHEHMKEQKMKDVQYAIKVQEKKD